MGKIKKITVTNRVAYYSPRGGYIICDNKGYKIKFSFDEEWASYPAKTACFVYNGNTVEVPFTGDQVDVPPIVDANEVTVGVYADDIATTTPASITCVRSIKSLKGTPLGELTPTQYEELLARINSAEISPTNYGTTDLIAGESELATGKLYFVYE